MSSESSIAGRPPREESVAGSRVRFLRSFGRRAALALMAVGDILVIASLFSPWLDVSKTGPDFPTHLTFGPDQALERGAFDDLTAAAVIFFVVAAGLVLCALVLALARAADSRSTAAAIATGLALAGLVTIGLAVIFVPMLLSLNYPYYDSTVDDGTRLVLAGFLAVLVGAVIANILELRSGKQEGAQT